MRPVVVPTARELVVRLVMPGPGGRFLAGEPSIGGEVATRLRRASGLAVLPAVRTAGVQTPDLTDGRIRCTIARRRAGAPHRGKEQRHRARRSTEEYGTTTDTNWLALARGCHRIGAHRWEEPGSVRSGIPLYRAPHQPRTCTHNATTSFDARIATGLGPRH